MSDEHRYGSKYLADPTIAIQRRVVSPESDDGLKKIREGVEWAGALIAAPIALPAMLIGQVLVILVAGSFILFPVLACAWLLMHLF